MIVITASSTAREAAGRYAAPTPTAISAVTHAKTASPAEPAAAKPTMSKPNAVANAGAPPRVNAPVPPLSPPPPPPPTAAIRQHTHRLLQAAVGRSRHDVYTDGSHVAIHGRALQRPHPVHQGVLLVFERRTIENVDGQHHMAALAQI